MRIAFFTDYLTRQIEKVGVRVVLECEATSELVIGENPDVVILASGANPSIPKIQGINRKKIVTSQSILSQGWDAGGKVVVLGSELIACEIASYLAGKGQQVTLAGTSSTFGIKIIESVREPLLSLLESQGVTMLAEVGYDEITNEGLVIRPNQGGRRTLACDTIVPAISSTPNKSLLEMLNGKVPEIYSIGDCVQPRNIYSAVYEGFHMARTL